MEQEEPKISLEMLTTLAEDPNSMLFDNDKVNNDTANWMAIEEAKLEETTIVPPKHCQRWKRTLMDGYALIATAGGLIRRRGVENAVVGRMV